jgi:hypothetical protein
VAGHRARNVRRAVQTVARARGQDGEDRPQSAKPMTTPTLKLRRRQHLARSRGL